MSNYQRLSSNDMRERQSENLKKKLSKKKGALNILKKVFNYSREYRFYLYAALFLDIVYTLSIITMPIYTGYAINCIVSAGNVNFAGLYKNILILAGLTCVSGLTNFLQQVCLAKFNYMGTYKIRDLLFEKFQKVPISFIDTSSHGDLISRMINDIDIMTDGFLESFATALSGLTTIIGTLVAMFMLNIKLSFIILLITPLSIITSAIIVKN